MEPIDLAHEDWQLATHHFQQGDDASAEKICREILEELPAHLGATHLLGVICGKSGRLPEAIQMLQRASQLEPSSAEIMAHLSFALSQAGAHARALTGFQRVRELNPTSVDAVGMIGSLSLQLGRYSEAAEALVEAADLRPRSPDLQMLKGHALYRIGAFADAESSLRRALELKPSLTEASVFLGKCLIAQGKYADAETVCRPHATDARFQDVLIRLHQASGREEEALRIAREGVESLSPSGSAVRLLASEDAKSGDLMGAMQAIRSSLPRLAHDTIDMADTMFVLARLQHASGDAGGALKTALQAREALAPQGKPKFARGKHYLRMLERLAAWPTDAELASWCAAGEDAGVCAIAGMMGSRSDLLAESVRAAGVASISDGRSTLVGLGGEIPGHRLGAEVYPAMISALDEHARTEVRRTYLRQFADGAGKVRVDAHAHNIEHLAALARIVPGFKAVVVVRRPDDALGEALLEPTRTDESALVLTSVADMAAGILGQCRALKRALQIPGMRLMVLDADDLHGDPAGAIARVIAFITGESTSDGVEAAAAHYAKHRDERMPTGCGAAFGEAFAPVRGMLDSIGSMGLGRS